MKKVDMGYYLILVVQERHGQYATCVCVLCVCFVGVFCLCVVCVCVCGRSSRSNNSYSAEVQRSFFLC